MNIFFIFSLLVLKVYISLLIIIEKEYCIFNKKTKGNKSMKNLTE